MILLIIYWVLGFWATGKVLYANKIVISSGTTFFCKKLGIGLFFGWALIPIALLKVIFGRH